MSEKVEKQETVEEKPEEKKETAQEPPAEADKEE